MEAKHLTQSRIYYLGREYVKQVIAGQITLDEAISEVRSSTKIDYQSKMRLVADIHNKWKDWTGYNAVKMSETIDRLQYLEVEEE